MGNAFEPMFCDAYGNALEEGTWVEVTTRNGVQEMAGIGRVKFINDFQVVFEWPGLGLYTYNEADIRYWGLRVVLADVKGYKLKLGQKVVCTREEYKQGSITEVGQDSVAITFKQSQGIPGFKTSYWSQRDLDQYGVRIDSDSRRMFSSACA